MATAALRSPSPPPSSPRQSTGIPSTIQISSSVSFRTTTSSLSSTQTLDHRPIHLLKVTGDQEPYPSAFGPPPPSPPASVTELEPSMREPVLFDEPEQIQSSSSSLPQSESLKRSITDAKLSFRTPETDLNGSLPSDTYLQPPSSRPTRRNTTGSTSWNAPRTSQHTQFGSQPHAEDLEGELASDIQLHAEQIRRERQSKRAKQQQEAEAALTRNERAPPVRHGSKDEDKVLVGNIIGEDHVNYVLMYNMLTGIRIGVSRCQAKIKRPLTDEDYVARHKFSFDIVGNELTPSAKYDFKFKDYAPWVFRELREDLFHLDPADYLLSLTSKYILSELGSPGKSGSFFYFSRDYRFIIKTIRSTVGRLYPEAKAEQNPRAVLKDLNWINRGKMLEIGPEKRALLTEQLRRDAEFLRKIRVMDYSLLIGIHKMERGNRDNVRRNTLKVFSPDITMVRRATSTAVKGGVSAEAIAIRRAMRESDPKRLGHGKGTIRLPEEDTGDRRDFLFYQDEGGLRATDETNDAMDKIYYLGVIDILTPYTFVKQLEHFWKGLSADRHKISPVEPNEYGDRLISTYSPAHFHAPHTPFFLPVDSLPPHTLYKCINLGPGTCVTRFQRSLTRLPNMMFGEAIRPGNRGGQGDFKWSDVSADKDRENYLGHSINAPTGRWQKNKDVHWYSRDKDGTEDERDAEIRKIKEAEADALAVALGFAPATKTAGDEGGSSGGAPVEDPDKAERRRRKAERKEEKRMRKEHKRLEREARRSRSRSPVRRSNPTSHRRSRTPPAPRRRSFSPEYGATDREQERERDRRRWDANARRQQPGYSR
ncbi:Phosphatidylinositol phosphate kinase PIPK5 [Mycena indigotica]|uniref:Phosphatidylinositol phosphate kinase PIPK5 n=1 Tax=Mycena indigotica TaxID=2126181 RepID=A0A8H6T731_9AGAR|nr:Phosphatidylinositol phosphate kinase PIPK5 [Mycena indigotica]KAF7312141.1 Phosphatidylinositol phosphate kinase PIPK5 [Mycena indigotica]